MKTESHRKVSLKQQHPPPPPTQRNKSLHSIKLKVSFFSKLFPTKSKQTLCWTGFHHIVTKRYILYNPECELYLINNLQNETKPGEIEQY